MKEIDKVVGDAIVENTKEILFAELNISLAPYTQLTIKIDGKTPKQLLNKARKIITMKDEIFEGYDKKTFTPKSVVNNSSNSFASNSNSFKFTPAPREDFEQYNNKYDKAVSYDAKNYSQTECIHCGNSMILLKSLEPSISKWNQKTWYSKKFLCVNERCSYLKSLENPNHYKFDVYAKRNIQK